MAARSLSDIFGMRGDPSARRAEARARRRGRRQAGLRYAEGGAALRTGSRGRSVDQGRRSDGADANPEHAWNDMLLYPICQEENFVPVIFLRHEAWSGHRMPPSRIAEHSPARHIV